MKKEEEGAGSLRSPGADAPQDGELVLDAMLRWGFIKSYAEGRRLIANGGVALNGSQCFDGQARVTDDSKTIRVGKRVYDIVHEGEALPSPQGEGPSPSTPDRTIDVTHPHPGEGRP